LAFFVALRSCALSEPRVSAAGKARDLQRESEEVSAGCEAVSFTTRCASSSASSFSFEGLQAVSEEGAVMHKPQKGLGSVWPKERPNGAQEEKFNC
jgi:hypothetical protein